MYWHSNVSSQLTEFVVTLIFCAGVCMYHSGLKASGSWAVFSLSSLFVPITSSLQARFINVYT